MERSAAPPGFDPARDVVLDARNLRGLAHPLRLQLLAMLRETGPATATQLAARVGESSAATSYHLRQLATYGFVDDEPEKGRGRERWWRSAHRSTYFDLGADESEAGQLLGVEYLRGVVRAYAARMEAWIDALPTVEPAWRDAATMSDYRLRLTPEQAVALVAELDAIGVAHRDDGDPSVSAAPASRRVAFQFQVIPDPRDVTREPQHD